MKKHILPFVLILLIAFAVACTHQTEITDPSLHPPEFATYYAQLGWHKNSVLEALGVTEAELTETSTYTYATTKTVVFQNLSFRVFFQTAGDWNRFTGFSYMAVLEGDSKTQANQILDLARLLSERFGSPTDGASAYPQYFVEMTAEELEAWLSDGKQGIASDSWYLGQTNTEEAVAYTAFLEGYHAAANTQTKIAEYPQLKLTISIYKNGQGSVQVQLQYSLDCFS